VEFKEKGKMMKYCPYCGTENEDSAQFCVKCGKPFEDGSPVNEANGENTDKENPNDFNDDISDDGGSISIAKVVVIILGCILIIVGLFIGGHRFYMNHRSDQATANIAQTIANEDFGDDEVQVYYSKSDNTLTIKTESDSKIRKNLKEYVIYGDNQDDMNDVISQYKDFINDMYDHMGTKYKKYYTCIENPWNNDKVYIDSRGTKVDFDGLDD